MEATPGSTFYSQAESRIEKSLEAFTTEGLACFESFMLHLRRFMDKISRHSDSHNQDINPPRTTPEDYPASINSLLYDALSKSTHCICAPQKYHQPKLLLKPGYYRAADGNIEFDMVFSSRQSKGESQLIRWQDVQLLVSRLVSFTLPFPKLWAWRFLQVYV
jgi:hypothetical protein